MLQPAVLQPGVLLTNTRAPLPHEVAQWQRHGVKVHYQSLLNVVHLPVAPLAIRVQAIVLSSANGAASLQNSAWDRRIPVYGVGSATVAAAKAAGFIDCTSPNSRPYPSAINLISWIKQNLRPSDGVVVHGSGVQLRHDLADLLRRQDFEALRVVLYKTEMANSFNPEIEQSLKAEAIQAVAIASEQTLQTFVSLCKNASIDFQKFKLLLPSRYLRGAASRLGFMISS